jgi:hypothetical protein
MSLKFKFILIVAIGLALVLAFGGEGMFYNPIDDGMPHNTTGQEWPQKQAPSGPTPSPQGKY